MAYMGWPTTNLCGSANCGPIWAGPLWAYVGRSMGRYVEAQLVLPIVDKPNWACYSVGLDQPILSHNCCRMGLGWPSDPGLFCHL